MMINNQDESVTWISSAEFRRDPAAALEKVSASGRTLVVYPGERTEREPFPPLPPLAVLVAPDKYEAMKAGAARCAAVEKRYYTLLEWLDDDVSA